VYGSNVEGRTEADPVDAHCPTGSLGGSRIPPADFPAGLTRPFQLPEALGSIEGEYRQFKHYGKTEWRGSILALGLIAGAMLTVANGQVAKKSTATPLTIQEQGSFAVGGKVVTKPGTFNPKQPTPDGQTLHGDHAYVFYQIPVNPHKLPLVFLHGTGQFSKTWETTPDGREGFQTIFLRRRFPVYLIDQPRRGNAGRSTVSAPVEATPDEQNWFDTFRVGIWPEYFPGVQFSKDPEALNQYFRQMTPNVGPYDPEVISDACAALFDKIGPAVFVTHSQGGGLGWLTAVKSGKVRAIVSYEPGSGFIFPQGEVPEPLPGSSGPFTANGVPMADFTKLTKIPIIIFYGDNIPEKPSDIPGQDGWRVRMEMARKWRDTVNRHGGDVTVVLLPEAGLRGNTHFPFSDLNNKQVADLMSKFLTEKKLD
jgi:pimeloyl-ACP methyl ester carboxylesterase